MVVALLDHLPEWHMRRIAVLRHVGGRHPERIGLDLERALAAEERLAGERIDFGNLLVGHRIAAARGAVAVDHQESAGAPMGAIEGVRKTHVDGEIVAGIRIHQARGDGIESLRRLAVAFLDLGTKLARPAADRVGPQQRIAAGFVHLPDFQLRFLLEDAHQDRRFFSMLRRSMSAIRRSESGCMCRPEMVGASVSQPPSAMAAAIAADAKSERTKGRRFNVSSPDR